VEVEMIRKVQHRTAIAVACVCFGGVAVPSASADTQRKIEIHRALADIYEKLGQAPSAMEQYAALSQLAPQDASVQVQFGTLLARQKQYKLAIDHYRRAVQLNPSPDNYGALGDGLFWAHDYKGAVDAYTRAGQRWAQKLGVARQYYQNQIDQENYNKQMKDRD
jgi:Tfp pilus assembly protein PilF